MLTCKELIEFLGDYLSGDLTPEVRERFDAHLELCPPCVAYLKTYQETVRLGKAAFRQPEEDVPEEVPEELVQAILAARRQTRPGRSP